MFIASLCGSLLLGQLAVADERAEAFRWFDTLGQTELLRQPFVRVDMFYKDALPSQGRHQSWYGFLSVQIPMRVRIKGVGSYDMDFLDSRDTVKAIKPVDFEVWARRQLPEIQKAPRKTPYESYEGALDPIRLFVISRVAELRAFSDLSSAYFAECRKSFPVRWDDETPLLDRIQTKFSKEPESGARSTLSWARVSHAEAAKRLERVAHDYPRSSRTPELLKIAANLRRIAEQEARHRPIGDKELVKLPIEEQIDELVHRLKDEGGMTSSRVGPVYAIIEEESPAERLEAIGPPTVLRLIQALTDDRLTREQWEYRELKGIIPVSGVALSILNKIAVRYFDYDAGLNLEKPADVPRIQELVRVWHEEVQRRGEEAILLERIGNGDRHAARIATRLIKAYPRSAVTAIARGLPVAAESYDRSELVKALGASKDPAARRLALEQLRHGKDIPTRVEAAKLVARTDPALAYFEMERLWRIQSNLPLDGADFRAEIIPVLAKSGRATSIEAMAQGLGRQPVFLRYEILNELRWAKVSESNRGAIESLLASQLDCEDHVEGLSSSGGGSDFDNPLLGEVSLFVLWTLFPKVYAYRAPQSEAERAGLLKRGRETWQRRQGAARSASR